jgi:TfoX/Sxy family transcriptional regulator of competence genes
MRRWLENPIPSTGAQYVVYRKLGSGVPLACVRSDSASKSPEPLDSQKRNSLRTQRRRRKDKDKRKRNTAAHIRLRPELAFRASRLDHN